MSLCVFDSLMVLRNSGRKRYLDWYVQSVV